MKNNAFIFLLLLTTLFVLGGCNDSSKSADNEQVIEEQNRVQPISFMDEAHIATLPDEFKQIHENGKITVALYSEDRYPYFFVNKEGELVGSDIEMAYDIARRIGVEEVEFDRSAQTYDEIIDLVVDKKVDMAIAKISVTSNRAQRVLFSDPYIRLKQAVLINRIQLSQMKAEQQAELETMDILMQQGIELGVVGGTSYVEFAKEAFPYATIVSFETKEDLLEAVREGEVLAAFYDEFEFKRYMTDHPDASLDLQLLVIDGRDDFLAIAVSVDNILLKEWLNHYLAYQIELQVDDILQKYRGETSVIE